MQWRRSDGRKSGAPLPAEQHSPAPTPSRAVYGFVLYLAAGSGLAAYLAWAVVPDALLHQAGIDFLPQKYWAVALPLYAAVVFTIFVFVVYPSLGLLHCPADSDSDLTRLQWPPDRHAISPDSLACSRLEGEVPPVYDIPYEQLKQCLVDYQ